MAAIREHTAHALAAAGSGDPLDTAMATAYALGLLVQMNTFSALDGAVPEELGDKLDTIHADFESDAEQAFLPWLDAGFKVVREQPMDELERWSAEVIADVS